MAKKMSETSELALSRLSNATSLTAGAGSVEDAMKGMVTVDLQEVTLNDGDVLAIPAKDYIQDCVFLRTININGREVKTAGMVFDAKDKNGQSIGSKVVYFSAFRKIAIPCTEAAPFKLDSAHVRRGDGKLNQAMMKCANVWNFYEKHILPNAGKTIKVSVKSENKDVTIARYDATNNIVGTRKTSVFNFDIA